jgi:diguanylate cyclase (GGDEF)-like protein/PAS domain S-box-containing protein
MICALPPWVFSMADDSEDLLRVFIDQAPVAIAMLDRQMRYVAASRRWLSDYGFTDRDIHGMSHYELFPDIPEGWRDIHRRALTGEIIASEEDRFDRADGTVQWLRWEVRPWHRNGVQGGIIIFAVDITRRKHSDEERKRDQLRVVQLNAELEQRVLQRTSQLEETVAKLRQTLEEADRLRTDLREQAIRDPLTGLFNRRFLEETLAHEVARARRGSTAFGLLMFDIDNFKVLNDTYGHVGGDAVLRGVGKVMGLQLRAQDVACRFGGDEFIVVMPETSLENACYKARELLGRLKRMHLEPVEMPLPDMGFSMGVAAFPDHGDSGDGLLQAVDAALYRAKQQGGDRVVAAIRYPREPSPGAVVI